ncbi:MAG TPA: hypothetical protein VGW35_14390 [Methylomirabilota bacterium]|jgi:hypothetical protein|nr:hypothetical protein [Methylomirabilota bacterium]
MSNGAGSDIVGDFRLGLDLMKRYPVMAAPPLIAMALMFVLGLVFFGGALTIFAVGGLSGGRGVAGAIVGGLLFSAVLAVVALLVNLVASAVVVIMARDALATREPSMGDALSAVMGRLGDVAVASFLVALIVGIASLFLVVPGIIAGFFLMFVLPAVLLDGRGAVDALGRSATLVKDNLGPALGLVIGAIVAIVVMAIVSMILGMVPLLGHLASMLLGGAFIAYLTVVAVRVYQTLPRR